MLNDVQIYSPLPEPGAKVIVGLSGGVDSSVSALILKSQGYDVTAVFMKNWEEDDTAEFCSAEQDIADAQSVCDHLGIEFLTINFAAEYWDHVFEYFLAEYRAGRTPNPDILCNREIKFKAFLNYAKHLNASHIATGHYAGIALQEGRYCLKKGLDTNKDQSYFLYALKEAQLQQSLFPVGALCKPEVRKIAQEAGLVTYPKKDSTGICFIGERKFKSFLETYLPAQPGNIVNESGKIMGQHQGLMYHTIGQRQGLLIGGQKNSTGEPWYVAQKNITSNELIVVQGENHPLLFQETLDARQLTWVGSPPQDSQVQAKTRYRQPDQACHLEWISEDHLKVHFEHPQRAITPGQSLVLYQGDTCLGGGIIAS